MARVRPVSLRFVRPDLTDEVPSPPHDALSAAARRNHLARHPRSYLGVTRAPDDMGDDTVDPAAEALRAGRRHLEQLLADGVFGEPTDPALFVYRLAEDDHEQAGLVCAVATGDYDLGTIRIHERINRARSEHLARHLRVVGAQSSPIALAFRELPEVEAAIARATAGPPLLDFTDEQGLTQQLWRIDDPETIERITRAFEPEALYLIDGHHRAAAASMDRALVGGGRDDHRMLATAFPYRELRNQAFHRIVTGFDSDELERRITAAFPVRPAADLGAVEDRAADEIALCLPRRSPGEAGRWLLVRVPRAEVPGAELYDIDPIRLADQVLGPVLGVDEAEGDRRLTYRPGMDDAASIAELDLAPGEALFLMRPVPMQVLMGASDRGQVMPPKSTYFMPKVRSGLFVRVIDQYLP